jgi:pyrimidine deaminase RibD-like protein
MNPTKQHYNGLNLALEVAENCTQVQWYGVGCIIIDGSGDIISTGFTGELYDGNSTSHAEEIALIKAHKQGADLSSSDTILYSTLEPCSQRASGKKPCTAHIIESGLNTVVYGAREPFVPKLGIICQGHIILQSMGLRVIFLNDMEQICLASAKKNSINLM